MFGHINMLNRLLQDVCYDLHFYVLFISKVYVLVHEIASCINVLVLFYRFCSCSGLLVLYVSFGVANM